MTSFPISFILYMYIMHDLFGMLLFWKFKNGFDSEARTKKKKQKIKRYKDSV